MTSVTNSSPPQTNDIANNSALTKIESFWGRHKVKILTGAAIVATITAVALAVLCWPATLGAAGTFVAAHITGALAAIPLAAKVTAVATTALLALISAIGGLCSKLFNKTTSSITGSLDEMMTTKDSKESAEHQLKLDLERDLVINIDDTLIGHSRHFSQKTKLAAMPSEHTQELISFLENQLPSDISDNQKIKILTLITQKGSIRAIDRGIAKFREQFPEILSHGVAESIKPQITTKNGQIIISGQALPFFIRANDSGDREISKNYPISYEYNITNNTFRILFDNPALTELTFRRQDRIS